MKEVVYTTVFLALAILLLVVFLIMFGSGKKESAKNPVRLKTTKKALFIWTVKTMRRLISFILLIKALQL